MSDDYNPDERCGEPGEDDMCLQGIEISFGIETWISQDHQQLLLELLNEIVKAPCNAPVNGVHWVSSLGSKMNFSRIDSVMIGQPVGPNPPPDGEEPISDETIFAVSTSARGFVADRERESIMAERKAKAE